jgi:predicted nucleotidyltransferase
MRVNSDFSDLLREFSAGGVRFLLVGAHALAVHAEPRATGDLDVWVSHEPENAKRVYAALARFGAPLGNVEVDEFTSDDLIYQMGVVPRRIDVITSIDGVSFEEAWKDRVEIELDGITVQVIGRKAFVANKRAAGRPKDLGDVESVLRHHPEDR